MKVIALLQARTDSSRLPGKVLKEIIGIPMIIHQLKRTEKSKYIDKLILVTSNEKSDDELVYIVQKYGFIVYRGNKNNVLDRFFNSLKEYNLNDDDIIIRLTGDCPLHDASIIDESIEEFLKCKCDYLANCIEAVYPDGLDVEVFNYSSLKHAYENASLKSEWEHVTPHIRKNIKLKLCNLMKKPIHTDWRLTVDEDVDFDLIDTIYKHFNKTFFSFNDVVVYLKENPYLLNINKHINRNEGYAKSLKEN